MLIPGVPFLNTVISGTLSLQKENTKVSVQIIAENVFTDASCLPEIIFIQVGNNQLYTNLGLQISTSFEIDTYILK